MGISFDVTDDEVKGALKGFELLPDGDYEVIIDEVTEKSVGSGANEGKPMYGITYKIEGGEFAGRKLWQNIMLFPTKDGNVPFSLIQLLSSLDMIEEGVGSIDVPEPFDLMGGSVLLRVATRNYTDSSGEKKTINDVKRIMHVDGDSSSGKNKDGDEVDFDE